MRLKSPRRFGPEAEVDWTPMIDVTFQLIAFFMFVINFSDAEQDERINLPLSELAKPPESPAETPLTIQLTKDGNAIFAGEVMPITNLKPILLREKQVLENVGKNADMAIILVRADADSPTGRVQDLIRICQEAGFERFSLRAKQAEHSVL